MHAHIRHLQVGPLANPTEAYRASSLPICLGIPGDEELDLIEDGLSGRRDESTPIDLRFRVNEEWQLLCEHTYKDKELKRIKDAIFEVCGGSDRGQPSITAG